MSARIDEVRSFLTGPARRPILAVIGIAFVAWPYLGLGHTDVLTEAIIFGLFAISVDIALGYTGLLTLAPAAFFGLGAYSMAKLVVDYGQSFWLGFPAAVVVGGVAAFLVGYVPIRQRIGNVYFALFTLAFGAIAFDFTYVTTSITGGSNGLGFFTPPELFGVAIGDTKPYYYFTLALVAAVGFGVYYLLQDDFGDVLHAIRQNEHRMRYLGYDTNRERMIAWILSASASALAGAAFVGMVGIASPSLMSFGLTGEVIIWLIVGGTGTLTGPFAAAVALTLLRDILASVWLEGYRLLLGLLFVAFVFLLPDGIVGLLRGEE